MHSPTSLDHHITGVAGVLLRTCPHSHANHKSIITNQNTTFFLLLTLLSTSTFAANLLTNSGFEEGTMPGTRLPTGWLDTSGGYDALRFSDRAYEKARCAATVSDGKPRMWRQTLYHPTDRGWRLSGYVKAEGVAFGPKDYANLYCHVIYAGRPYAEATHICLPLEPGTYDWKRVEISGVAVHAYDIEKLHISIHAKIGTGRFLVDQVELVPHRDLEPAPLLRSRIADLRNHLSLIKHPDETVSTALAHLDRAETATEGLSPNMTTATHHWVDAAQAISHASWAIMFPKAMTDVTTEARMLYHGMDSTREGIDRRLDLIEKTGCNAMCLSFGSWNWVIYHSDVLPVHEDWRHFDALTYFIEQAHARGLKVFGHIAAFYGTHDMNEGPGTIASKHPEWIARGPDATMPRFPDPANPDVVQHIVNAYVELATRYHLDGIGLDDIRYPTSTALNHDDRNWREIKRRYRIDIRQHDNIVADTKAWKKIQRYRANAVTNVVTRVRQAVKRARANVTVMACLLSDPQNARDNYGQHWEQSAKWLDYVSPMNYDEVGTDLALLARQRKICVRHRASFIPVIGGMPDLHRAWPISKWADLVATQRRAGADGIILYRIGEFDPAVASFFGNGAFYGKVEFPAARK